MSAFGMDVNYNFSAPILPQGSICSSKYKHSFVGSHMTKRMKSQKV